MTSTIEIRADILGYLKRHPGQMICITDLSRMLGVGFSSVKAVLVELHTNGFLLKTAAGKSKYWLPTDEEIESERRVLARAAPCFRPLKPRNDHREALERAKAVRAGIKSIG